MTIGPVPDLQELPYNKMTENTLSYTYLGDLKYQRIYKSHNWFNSYGDASGVWVDFV